MASNFEMANALRKLSIDAVEKAKSGHPGMPMGCADIAFALARNMSFDPKNPEWHNRDRFVLSAGHGAMLLYSLLYLLGYDEVSLEQIKNFRQLGAKTAGHPEYERIKAVESTTGPLGQGLSNAVGMAIAEKKLKQQFGSDIVDHYTFVLVSDGDLMEGISHEAISIAGHLKLSKLIVIYDDNKITIDGSTKLSETGDCEKRFIAAGFHVQKIDGHDFDQIENAILNAKKNPKPSMIACQTIIGYGSPNKEGKNTVHGAPLGKDEIQITYANLKINQKPFKIENEILNAWRKIGENSAKKKQKWQKILNQSNKKDLFLQTISSKINDDVTEKFKKIKKQFLQEKPHISTREASNRIIEQICPIIPNLVGGSADLSTSNNTLTNNHKIINSESFEGNYIHYGVREHAMSAIMNGMALHGGVIPYGGTFLVFSDYCRPAVRLSAMMRLRVIYIFTHDSIGVGEDGPTHQPVEHLGALRLIPNLLVMRPADPIETLECWQTALENHQKPSALILTRQKLPFISDNIPNRSETKNLSQNGAYVIKKYPNHIVNIFASGSEVQIACQAAQKLAEQNIFCQVISVPMLQNFNENSQLKTVFNDCKINVAIEAAVYCGWQDIIGKSDNFIGIKQFGISAPAQQIFEKFGITCDNLCNTIIRKIKTAKL